MNKILEKRVLTPNVVYMKVDASRIAKKAEPGQFVMIMPNEKSERIPLTIADYDREEGSISIPPERETIMTAVSTWPIPKPLPINTRFIWVWTTL